MYGEETRMSKEETPNGERSKPKFKIVDKRRIDPDEIPPQEAAEQPVTPPEPPADVKSAESQETKADQGQAAADQEQAAEAFSGLDDPVAFANVCVSIIQTLATVSWVYLGLVPHPQTQLVVKRMEEARKAIALTEHIIKVVKPELPSEVNLQLAGLLRDLKANYVNQL